eukprot:3881606-Rhodomonas_salina.3
MRSWTAWLLTRYLIRVPTEFLPMIASCSTGNAANQRRKIGTERCLGTREVPRYRGLPARYPRGTKRGTVKLQDKRCRRAEDLSPANVIHERVAKQVQLVAAYAILVPGIA